MSVLILKERSPESKPKTLRKGGLLPMALVEKGGKTVLVQAGLNDVKRALSGAKGAGMIDVQVEGQTKLSAVVKQIDRDILSRSITHLTLQQVNKDDMIRVDVPIHAIGTPQAVLDGEAILMHPTDHIKVRGKVSAIPDHVEVDVSGLGIHESITAGSIELPKGVELQSSPDSQLFSVTIPKEPELETTEPEVTEVPTVGESEQAE